MNIYKIMPQSIFEHMAIDFTIKINVKQINDNDLNLPLGLLKYHTVDSRMTMLPRLSASGQQNKVGICRYMLKCDFFLILRKY